MIEVTIRDAQLRQAASEGMDAFVAVFIAAIKDSIQKPLRQGCQAVGHEGTVETGV